VLTLFSVWLAGLLGGSVVVEVIFTVPGMGRLLYESVVNNDIPVIQAGIVSLVGLAVLVTTLTDVVHTWLNPTVRAAHVPA
jgi:peptide/nickel transport system permease protein